jgi:F0F1-type ATP synthase epsilon subunit
MECRILACDRIVFAGEAQAVYAKGAEGWFGILPGHAPAAFSLTDAPLRVETGDGTHAFRVKNGMLRVHRDVVILADEVEGA